MQLHFTISELCIDPTAQVPQDVADKILAYHIHPMNPIRQRLNAPIWATDRSCWRHKSWERARGRDPDDPSNSRTSWSRHTFTPLDKKDPKGKGASDWTTRPERAVFGRMFHLLFTRAPYSRIAWYPDQLFFHCDYGYEDRGKTLFIAGEGGWKRAEKNEIISSIDTVFG